jgi:hypothetical protein
MALAGPLAAKRRVYSPEPGIGRRDIGSGVRDVILKRWVIKYE